MFRMEPKQEGRKKTGGMLAKRPLKSLPVFESRDDQKMAACGRGCVKMR